MYVGDHIMNNRINVIKRQGFMTALVPFFNYLITVMLILLSEQNHSNLDCTCV